MAAERYVATEALRQAMRGREAEVLRALGIERKKGAHHISCPYPDHADQNPSWRWDERKARAFCTCITQRGGHAILEIVKRMEGTDFDAAKLRVAEILGRSDLVETRGQRMDAASLLQPPADQREDALGSRYLAFRLGVPRAQVPMPSTKAVGWRALPYYDPPAGKQSKPRLVGRYPCVVFATVAPDGRQHAHRIYVAHHGQGKAELGSGPNGSPRDPKKSARLREGESAAGCAVLWGDPATAPHLLVAEGIETAAALALAHREEVEAGGLAIVAALSTSGLRTFAPWPATRTITIAADRDEGSEVNDRGHRAGERAARAFALKHREAAKASWFDLVFVGFVLAFISGSIGVVGPDECFFFGPCPEEDRPDRKLLRLDLCPAPWMPPTLPDFEDQTMRGRKPLPSNVVKLRGNPGKRRLNDAEPRPAAKAPSWPSCLGEEAGKDWKRLSKELAELGLLTTIDRGLLAAYCQAHALWVEAVSSIERYGTMVKSPNGFPMQSPYVAVANKQVDIMVRIAAEFGMTPSSRTRIRVGEKTPQDSFEVFLQDRG